MRQGSPTEHRQEVRLPADVSAGLPLRIHQALNHPIRRHILRTLNDGAASQSLRELADAVQPGAAVAVIHYHTKVLEDCRSIRSAGLGGSAEDVVALYVSAVASDRQIGSVLRSTRALDGIDS